MLAYLIRNDINGKIYVGKTKNSLARRWREHVRCSVSNPFRSPLFYRAIRKYGAGNFSAYEVDYASTTEEICQKERYWIRSLRSAEVSVGYNLTMGGETGQLNSSGRLRKPFSAEHLKAIRESARGRKTEHMNTPEARLKKGLKLKGRFFSEETRKKMSQALKARIERNKESWNSHMVFMRSKRSPTSDIDSGAKRRFIGPPGTSWCSVCKDFSPLSNFYKHSKKWTGVQSVCKQHSNLSSG